MVDSTIYCHVSGKIARGEESFGEEIHAEAQRRKERGVFRD